MSWLGRDRCPSRVHFVQPSQRSSQGPQKLNHGRYQEKINGQEITNMLLDSGAEVTVLASEVVPTECYNGRQAEARGLLPRVTLFNLANITLEVNGWKLNLEVLVASPGALHSLSKTNTLRAEGLTAKLNKCVFGY